MGYAAFCCCSNNLSGSGGRPLVYWLLSIDAQVHYFFEGRKFRFFIKDGPCSVISLGNYEATVVESSLKLTSFFQRFTGTRCIGYSGLLDCIR